MMWFWLSINTFLSRCLHCRGFTDRSKVWYLFVFFISQKASLPQNADKWLIRDGIIGYHISYGYHWRYHHMKMFSSSSVKTWQVFVPFGLLTSWRSAYLTWSYLGEKQTSWLSSERLLCLWLWGSEIVRFGYRLPMISCNINIYLNHCKWTLLWISVHKTSTDCHVSGRQVARYLPLWTSAPQRWSQHIRTSREKPKSLRSTIKPGSRTQRNRQIRLSLLANVTCHFSLLFLFLSSVLWAGLGPPNSPP